MKKIAFFSTIFFMSVAFSSKAQSVYFTDVVENVSLKNDAGNRVRPEHFRTVEVKTNELHDFLWSLPQEAKLVDRKKAPLILLPMPDGKMARFRVWEYAMLEPGLAAKYPEIKTFTGYGVDDPYATVRFDYNPYFGFRAQVLSINGDFYIDPYKKENNGLCMSYYGRELQKKYSFQCNTETTEDSYLPDSSFTEGGNCRGPEIYTYRIAVSCTGEYATAVCSPNNPTVPAALAAITTTINRLNSIYEKELAMRFLLVANNDLIVYTNPATDPFTNGNADVMANENQAATDNAIGFSNYDIGQVFGTGNMSKSVLYSVCNSPNKAKSVSGLDNPFGDAFDVGRVAHNMAHKFGAQDTYNSNETTCSAGPAPAGFEPGSGTTIMSAAGSCGTDNLQPLPDPYFHSSSFDLITNYISGAGAGCRGIIYTGNNPPRFTNNVIYGFNIPMNTPFRLRGVNASDDDGDPVTYSWEQIDRGPAGSWNSALSAPAPAFRSRPPQLISDRVFPDMQLIAAGYPSNPPAVQGGLKGETLSPFSRSYQFSLTLRDGRGGVINAGSNCSSTTFGTHEMYTVPGTGPFKVNLPDGGESWSAGSQQTILWDVAGTTGNGINTQYVNISLSTDGGLTYPFVLASWVVNDGFEIVSLPNITTSTARIKVEAEQNVFFDISNSNFLITPVTTGFEFNCPALQSVNCPAPAALAYPLGVIANGGYTAPIQLSATGIPVGASLNFSANPVVPGTSITITLGNTNLVQQGTYYLTITGTSGSLIRNRVLALVIQKGAAPVITVQPVSLTDCEGSTVTFTCLSPTAIGYQWQRSTDGGFSYNNITTGGNQSSLTVSSNSGGYADKFRCIVSGQCNSTISNEVQYTVLAAPYISPQPQNAIVCEGKPVVFTTGATGSGTRYQWQVNKNDGAGFVSIAGESNNVLSIGAATSAMNNYLYRCMVLGTGCITPINTNSALLTVNNNPVVSLSASPYLKLMPGLQTTLTAAGNAAPNSLPIVYKWHYNSGIMGWVTGTSYIVGIDELGTYQVEINDSKGCSAFSQSITILDSVSNRLFMKPNPTSGEFSIQIHNPGGGLFNGRVIIYSAAGQKISDKVLAIPGYYPLIKQYLYHVAKGMYFVELRNSAGILLGLEKLLVQ